MIARLIHWSVHNRFLVILGAVILAVWGVMAVLRTPLDAIPDLSDTQVIIRTTWPGQAPRLIENQVTYPLTTTMLKSNDGFLDLSKVQTISDEAALVLVNHSGPRTKQIKLPGLTALTSVPLAKHFASQEGDLKLPKLASVSNEVAKALAEHQGNLDLSGLTTLSDEAVRAFAQRKAPLRLTGLTKLSEANAALLQANRNIALPAQLSGPAASK